jgi:regulator of replication initiation timing
MSDATDGKCPGCGVDTTTAVAIHKSGCPEIAKFSATSGGITIDGILHVGLGSDVKATPSPQQPEAEPGDALPAYDSPEGWWIRLSEAERAALYTKRSSTDAQGEERESEVDEVFRIKTLPLRMEISHLKDELGRYKEEVVNLCAELDATRSQPPTPTTPESEVAKALRHQIQKGKSQGGPISLTHELADNALALIERPCSAPTSSEAEAIAEKLDWLYGKLSEQEDTYDLRIAVADALIFVRSQVQEIERLKHRLDGAMHENLSMAAVHEAEIKRLKAAVEAPAEWLEDGSIEEMAPEEQWGFLEAVRRLRALSGAE